MKPNAFKSTIITINTKYARVSMFVILFTSKFYAAVDYYLTLCFTFHLFEVIKLRVFISILPLVIIYAGVFLSTVA